MQAYQSWGQTLVFPFDPFYEQPMGGRQDESITWKRRDAVMAAVRKWADDPKVDANVKQGMSGPHGLAKGEGGVFNSDPDIDPILYRMDQVRCAPVTDFVAAPLSTHSLSRP